MGSAVSGKMTAEELREACQLDPVLAAAVEEDCRSLNESAPFAISVEAASPVITCERCGTLVAAVREGLAADDWRARRWQRAIWEPKAWRKHTLRRCEAMQALGSAS